MEMIRASMPADVYAKADSFALAAFAAAWAVHKRVSHEIAAPGFAWTKTNAAGTEYASPWIAILNSQARIMASIGDRLGLDPKSRGALRLPSDHEPPSKFAGLLGLKLN